MANQGGHGNTYCLYLIQEGMEILIGLTSCLGRDGIGFPLVDIHHPDKLHLRKFGIDPGVVLTQVAYSHYTDLYSIHRDSIPTIDIPAWLAFSRTTSLSRSRVFPASRAKVAAFTSIIVSIVEGPIAGTSNRRS